jgi:hypothetical protein
MNNILYNKIKIGKNSYKISKTKLFDEKLNKIKQRISAFDK